MILARTNTILGHTDPDYTGISKDVLLREGKPRFLDTIPALLRLASAGNDLRRLVRKLGTERLKQPADDLTSVLVNANPDGESLTPQELASFFILLVVAGNETTRTALAHALQFLTDHPGQRALLLGDFERHIPGAVEEIVRFATPVISFRRNVTQDCDLAGRSFARGDVLVLFYNSANRDESVFADPDRFDITRSPNPHVGFGGPGPHYCLGAHLARRELTVMLRELLTRLPLIHATGQPDRLLSMFINGIKRMPFSVLRQVQREARREDRAAARVVARVDVTAVQAHVLPGDRQAQPAALGTRPRRVGLVEPVEHVRDRVRGQPVAVIAHLHRQLAAAPAV
jgi:cytochrome P450